jgi:hypothetical protein
MNENLEISTESYSKQYLLDPLSVIIKLAIISQKNSGVKISIFNNILQIQEVGIFQSVVRYYFNLTKNDLQYLYNPIELASSFFLNKIQDKYKDIIKSIKNLFAYALKGLEKLKITYTNEPLVIICINYYCSLINNYLDKTIDKNLFYKDDISPYYTDELINKLNDFWTIDKLNLVLEMIEYLYNDNSSNNIKCLEVFMNDIDLDIQKIFINYTL